MDRGKVPQVFSHPSVKFIHARDEQAATWIRRKLYLNVEVVEAPDIACALTLPPATSPGDQTILGLVSRQRPNQNDDYARIVALAEQAIAKGWKIRHIILGTGEVGERDAKDATKVNVEKELVRSESLEVLTKAIGECTALVSMKFHGTVIATMYGIPSTVLIPTNKNRNFVKRIDRPDFLSRFDAENLCDRFEALPEKISPPDVVMLRSRARDVMVSLKKELELSVGLT